MQGFCSSFKKIAETWTFYTALYGYNIFATNTIEIKMLISWPFWLGNAAPNFKVIQKVIFMHKIEET